MPTSIPVVSVQDIHLKIDGRSALSNVSLDFPAGSFTTIMGPGGSGKSTLVRLIAGLLPQVSLIEVWGTLQRPRREEFAFVPQRPRASGLSLRVLLAESAGESFYHLADADWAQWLAEEGLSKLAIPLETPADTLPRGHQQLLRVCAARWTRPQVLLLDEPFAGVFGDGADDLMDYMLRLRGQQTVIHVEHHQARTRQLADRVALLAAGQLVELADTTTFFTAPRSPLTAQFIRTGGVAITSVDADPLMLTVDPRSGFRVPLAATNGAAEDGQAEDAIAADAGAPPVALEDAAQASEAAALATAAALVVPDDAELKKRPRATSAERMHTPIGGFASVEPIAPKSLHADLVPPRSAPTPPPSKGTQPVITASARPSAPPAKPSGAAAQPARGAGAGGDAANTTSGENVTVHSPHRTTAPLQTVQDVDFTDDFAAEESRPRVGYRGSILPSFSVRKPAKRLPQPAQPWGRGTQNFSWLIKGELAGCPRPGIVEPVSRDLDRLARAGVDVIVTLTQTPMHYEEDDLSRFYEVCNFPIPDMKAPDAALAREVVQHMENHIRAGRSVAYHCRAGLGRTGTMLVMHLIGRGVSPQEALQNARSINQYWVQSKEQEEFLFAQPVGFLTIKP